MCRTVVQVSFPVSVHRNAWRSLNRILVRIWRDITTQHESSIFPNSLRPAVHDLEYKELTASRQVLPSCNLIVSTCFRCQTSTVELDRSCWKGAVMSQFRPNQKRTPRDPVPPLPNKVNRARPIDDPGDTTDPRLLAARRLMQRTEVALHEKQEERRKRASSGILSWLRDHGPHAIGMSLAFGAAGLAGVWCYYLLHHAFVAGRIVAMPTGVFCAFVLSYSSVYFQSAIEASFEQQELGTMTLADWREWFWTLPSTVGMLLLAMFIGYFVSWVWPSQRWPIILGWTFLAYPYFQLSALESGSALSPVSLPVARTFLRNPLAWILFFLAQGALVAIYVVILRILWRDPPLITMLAMGPVTALAVVAYATCLGHLARSFRFSVGEQT